VKTSIGGGGFTRSLVAASADRDVDKPREDADKLMEGKTT
jgi:hypothetical protein